MYPIQSCHTGTLTNFHQKLEMQFNRKQHLIVVYHGLSSWEGTSYCRQTFPRITNLNNSSVLPQKNCHFLDTHCTCTIPSIHFLSLCKPGSQRNMFTTLVLVTNWSTFIKWYLNETLFDNPNQSRQFWIARIISIYILSLVHLMEIDE